MITGGGLPSPTGRGKPETRATRRVVEPAKEWKLVTPPAEQALEYAGEIARALATAPGGLDLHAVIVHGSIGFGDYVAGRSDLDLLIVGDVAADGVAEIAGSIIAVPAATGIEGLECSLVSREDIASLEPARPFRLHVNLHREARRVVPGAGHAGDQDLTLHYAVARTCGIAIWGAPADEVFPPQPHALVTQAMLSELQWAAEKAEPCYAVLNAARAWAFAHEGVMLSKLGGWTWARRHDGPAQLLDLALANYLAPSATTVQWPDLQGDIDTFIDDISTALRTEAGRS
jgi:Domain of unknown function (DUF4111)